MSDFKVGDHVRVAENATYSIGDYKSDTSSVAGYEGVIVFGPDSDGDFDVKAETKYGTVRDAVQPRYLSHLTEDVNSPVDAVDHPSHYGGEGNTYEAIKVIEAWGLGFHLGNVVKYIARAGKKNPDKILEDLEKALWYLQREIEGLNK